MDFNTQLMYQVVKPRGGGKRARAPATPANKYDRMEEIQKQMQLINLQLNADHLLRVNKSMDDTLGIASAMEKQDWDINTFLTTLDIQTLEKLEHIDFVGGNTKDHIKKLCEIMFFQRLGISRSLEQITLLQELVEGSMFYHYSRIFFLAGEYKNTNFKTTVSTMISVKKDMPLN